jgi:hypothetical protein
MPRPLDTRLDLVAGRRAAGAAEQAAATLRQRRLWRAEAAMGAVIRNALARAGVDAAQAPSLCLASPAAGLAQDRALGDLFERKILALARGFAGAPLPDFANASFAELLAWALAQPPAD